MGPWKRKLERREIYEPKIVIFRYYTIIIDIFLFETSYEIETSKYASVQTVSIS